MGVKLEYGEISAVDFPSCRVRVRLDERDGVESFWLNVPQRNTQGVQRRPLLPELGEQVAILLDDDGVGGVLLGGVYSTVEPPPVVDETSDYVRFKDGTTVTYDQDASVLAVDCVGAITVKCAGNLSVESAGPVSVKAPSATLDIPEVTLNGNITVNGNINTSGNVDVAGNVSAGGSVIDVTGNSNHHTH
ncbi:hypothetical protein ALP29_00218 [Pseudomonas syringae pv. avii]|uniref:Phage baseplate assembly protein V n=1 Tax=Pseudomonas syringae pv. avii TaxID=663959 RepID=A0A3M5VHR5_PSESX|nr:phage baseplate assembly protein V [Pseudomonas azotoformans]RMT61669.1 hypothetical protein ALP43_03210 [Pseudomonas azotoformans]RMU57752.1 hypothetical protein ALP29_00218 [Pseudomonas syringae pv. avii]